MMKLTEDLIDIIGIPGWMSLKEYFRGHLEVAQQAVVSLAKGGDLPEIRRAAGQYESLEKILAIMEQLEERKRGKRQET